MKKTLAIIATISLMAGCATFELTEAGEKVRVLGPAEVGSCRELGKTNTSVTWSIMGIPRPEETVSKELRSIARNSAGRMNGDTIVPLTVVEEGKQTFVVYKCVNPDG